MGIPQEMKVSPPLEGDLMMNKEPESQMSQDILGHQEIKDPQDPLVHKDTEDLQDPKDLWDHRDHPDKVLD